MEQKWPDMNLTDPVERKLDAGEYVLGTLTAEERREFGRALNSDATLRTDLAYWESRLSELGRGLKPVRPHPRVWLDLAHRIETQSKPTRLPLAAAPRNGLLKSWAALATAASFVLAFGLFREMNKPPVAPVIVTERIEVPVLATSYVALLQVPKSTMHWSVSVTPGRNQLAVLAGGEAPAAAAKLDAELWIITDAGPVSMGVIPKTGEVRRALPQGLLYATGATIAVSLEPAGGSPTGKPTGPVVTTAQIVQAG